MHIRYFNQTFCSTLQTLKPLSNMYYILQKLFRRNFDKMSFLCILVYTLVFVSNILRAIIFVLIFPTKICHWFKDNHRKVILY